MPPLRPDAELATHTVANQPAPRGDLDLWAADAALRGAVARNGGSGRADALAAFGAGAGREAMRELGRFANRFPPELVPFDRGGRRLDEVRFHPAYHELMDFGVAAGYPAVAWDGRPGSHVAHAAMVYMLSQVEPGVCCPLTMTYAAVPALRAGFPDWVRLALSDRYDPASAPVAGKRGATLGMAMTEKQGGSDVRANATRAERDGEGWRLTGHKWFCSAPMSDGLLTLAQAPGGLTCFLVPRWTPDGARNAVRLVRLKDKLGNRANASAEIEYHGAFAFAVGDEGEGVRTIIEMVHHTRLDTSLAPAGLMRAALGEALWWCEERRAFGRRLIEQPLMAGVLADLAVEVEAATALAFRVARAFDEGDRPFARLAVALAKYLNNKRCPALIYEAMECLGGAGYVEDGPMPMLYREAPLNSIWEGSGNIIALDALRTLAREPEAKARLAAELEGARGQHAGYDRALAALLGGWDAPPPEAEARLVVERLGTLLAAAELLRAGAGPVAEAYVATRIEGGGGRTAGAWPARLDRAGILARARGEHA
jgi:putative acyl-CoA dehydrogenase